MRTGDATGAVRSGVGAIGKVIVAAGIIMGSVFWAFVLGDDRTVKAFGVGLGVAILVDALVVRMVLVPAVMHLLGRRAWYIPRWLDRALPPLTIEPADHREEVLVPPVPVPVAERLGSPAPAGTRPGRRGRAASPRGHALPWRRRRRPLILRRSHR